MARRWSKCPSQLVAALGGFVHDAALGLAETVECGLSHRRFWEHPEAHIAESSGLVPRRRPVLSEQSLGNAVAHCRSAAVIGGIVQFDLCEAPLALGWLRLGAADEPEAADTSKPEVCRERRPGDRNI